MATEPSHLLRAGATLALDALTAELLEGLRAVGVEAIVLKGPALARRLYAGEGRTHEDIDLLVSPAMFDRAEALLAREGLAMRRSRPMRAPGSGGGTGSPSTSIEPCSGWASARAKRGRS